VILLQFKTTIPEPRTTMMMNALLLVCTVGVVLAAPARVVTYNQMQNGTNNLLADVENVLIVIIPSNRMTSAAASLIDIDLRNSKIPAALRSNLPEAATESHATNVILQESDEVIKVPKPPEPAQSEVQTPEESETKEVTKVSEVEISEKQTEQDVVVPVVAPAVAEGDAVPR
jgi:outer membrane biosynthesis protein TonB